MFAAPWSWLESLAQLVVTNLGAVIFYPVDPNQRIYWVYLLASLAFATAVYLSRRGADRDGLLRFLFPSAVWRHPSAWLDVRYFFVHQIVRVWIYGAMSVGIIVPTQETVSKALTGVFGEVTSATEPIGFADQALVTVVLVVLGDFMAFAAHYLQHRVRILWEFHKVHHSLTVMHPLSNYREHWIDNLFYALVHSPVVGAVLGCSAYFYGQPVSMVDVLGINAFMFAFNVLGYNLRHSHVWIAWPSWLGYVLGSPAYHQIHHSCKPQHIDRNFAFLFPVWDWLFCCIHLPRDVEPLELGLGDGTEDEYRSVLRLYFLPFAKLFRPFRRFWARRG